MEQQNFKNHVRYYIPHHFVFYPVIIFLIGLSIYFSTKYPDQQVVWLFISILLFLIAWLSFMLRQHYALMIQDRTARLELRFRYYVLTHSRLELIEHQLSLRQILALRFASDTELPDLVQKTIEQNLSPGEIKKSIKNWQADNLRV